MTVQNIGNAKLYFETPSAGEVNNPAISTGFVLDTTTLPTACLNPVLTTSSSPVALPAGESCTLSAYFDPPATGPYSGSLIVYDNTLNVVTSDQIFPLNGTAYKSQTITFTPVTPVAFGTTQLLSASSTSGLAITFSLTGPGSLGATTCTLGTCTATLSYTGVGTVYATATQAGNATYAAASLTQSILVNQAAQTIAFAAPASPITYTSGMGTITLSATASSGLAVTFSLVSGPGSLSGANYATLTVTGTGTIVIAANQPGNTYFAAAPAVDQSIVVNAVPIAAAPTFALPAGTYALQQSVVILDSTPGATIYYTTNGTTPTPTNGTAIPSGTAITVSTSETVEAMAAASGYTNSPVAAADYIISPTAPDFTVTASPTSVTVTAGQSVATAITVTPLNGFNLAVTLACTSGLPTGATCAIAPATVTPAGGPVSAIVTITTTTATATLGTGSRPFFPATALALALCCFGIRKRHSILRMMVLLLVGIAGLGLVNGCAGSVGYTAAPTVSSLITVTATPSSGAAHTTSFLLGVRP